MPKPADAPRELENKRLFRTAAIDRAALKDDTRELPLAFASEEPVERYDWRTGKTYFEILDHSSEKSADLTRLNGSGQLLLEHDRRQKLGGVVKGSAKVDTDKKSRAIVKFSRSALAEQEYQDIKDGIPRNVSFGYETLGMIKSEIRDGVEYRTYQWCAYEISLVTIEADTTVGIGRSHEGKASVPASQVDDPALPDVEIIAEKLTPAQRMKLSTILRAPEGAPASGAIQVIDEPQLRAAGQKAERQRINEIEALADAILPDFQRKAKDIGELKRTHIRDGKTPQEFSQTLFDKLPEWRAENPTTMVGMGMSEAERNSYNYARALQSVIDKGMGRGCAPDGFEGEVHQEISKRKCGVQPDGFWVPFDRPVRTQMNAKQRAAMLARADLQAGIFAQGGAGIQTDIMLPVIELLRNLMVTERLGVRTISGLEGNIAWPRQVAKSGPLFVPETFALTTTNPLLDQVLASPKRVGVTGAVSRQLILQSSFDAQNWQREDQLLSLAVEVDRVTLVGAGAASEPTGIFNTIGIGSVTFAATPTYAKMVNFKTQLALANALASGMAFVTTPTVEEKLRTTPKIGSTFPIFIWEDGSWGDDTADGRMVGLRATATNQIPNDRVGFGNFPDAAKLMWGGIDTLINPYTRSKEAMVEITTNTWMDVLVRHQGSFAYSQDSGAQ